MILTSNSELHERRQRAVPRGVTNSLAVYAERAANAEIWDVEGRRYVDFASGISVLNTGHVHPKVQQAIAKQLEKVHAHLLPGHPLRELHRAIAEGTERARPGRQPQEDHLPHHRRRGGRERPGRLRAFTPSACSVIAFSGGFHGRTLACTSALAGKAAPYKTGFGPMLPEVYHLPYPMGFLPRHTGRGLAAGAGTAVQGVTWIPRASRPSSSNRCSVRAGSMRRRRSCCSKLRAVCDTHGIVFIADGDPVRVLAGPVACSRSNTLVLNQT